MAPETGGEKRRRALKQLLARYDAERQRQTSGEAPADDPYEYRISPLCYPGLRSFDPSEDRFFFGRRRNITEIGKKLAAERVVVVQGGSGTGKSSVIRAGLIPRLRDSDTLEGRHGNWYAAEFRPRTDPVQNLAGGLADLIARKFGGQPADLPPSPAAKAPDPVEGHNPELHAQVKDRLLRSFRQIDRDIADADNQNRRRTRRAWALLKVLRDFAAELDARDKLATGGLRGGPANLLLLVDQFEEVFRPEALSSGGQLLDLLIAAHTFLTQTPEGKASNLFIVVTMRTEELHRVGEYPALTLPEELSNPRHSVTLADVVTSSFYLIQVMDPDQDREDLKAAIVQPAREVLEDYNLLDAGHTDAPFDDGVVDWLLDGTKVWRDDEGQGHKADQLPLLQHALRVMWESALARWNSALQAGQMPAMLVTKDDLPQEHFDGGAEQIADIAYCLDTRADRASNDAARQFDKATKSGKKTTHSEEAGTAALRAAMRALARRDDRGNWARRFASIEAMDAFMAIDPDTASLPEQKRRQALREALLVLKADGYLSEGQNRDYDISHEALIRNWNTALTWLHEPTDTALAIERVLKDVEPWLIGQPGKGNTLREFMPRQLVDRLAPIEDPASPRAPKKPMICLPAEWSKEQIRLVVGTRGERGGWGSEDAALNKLREARRQVIEERQRWDDREAARQRRRRRLVVGVPVIASLVALFLGYTLVRYQDAKEVAVAAVSLAEFGYITSLNSVNGSPNAQRIKLLRDTREYLRHRQRQVFPNPETLLSEAYRTADSAARYTLGSLATLKDSQDKILKDSLDKKTLKVRCWRADDDDKDAGKISLGENGIDGQIKVNAGKASIIYAGNGTKNNAVVWDINQTASLQDAHLLPPNARVCMTENGSTLVVASPEAPVQIVNLLWQMSNGNVTLRGWQVVAEPGNAPARGFSCIQEAYERRDGDAVFTQILYRQDQDSSGTGCDKKNSETEATTLTFVRGLIAPVPLPAANDSDKANRVVQKCDPESATKESKEKGEVFWSCKTASGAQVARIRIAKWPTSATSFAVLSLLDTPGDDIFPATFVVDQVVISREVQPKDLTLTFECVGNSISLLISNQQPNSNGQPTRWAYVVGARAVDDLLDKSQEGGILTSQQDDPMMSLMRDALVSKDRFSFWNWIVEAPSRMLVTMRNNVFAFFSSSPPRLLCPNPAAPANTSAS